VIDPRHNFAPTVAVAVAAADTTASSSGDSDENPSAVRSTEWPTTTQVPVVHAACLMRDRERCLEWTAARTSSGFVRNDVFDLAELLVQIRVIPLVLPQFRISYAQVKGKRPPLEESDQTIANDVITCSTCGLVRGRGGSTKNRVSDRKRRISPLKKE
jgi:hypothetical protein